MTTPLNQVQVPIKQFVILAQTLFVKGGLHCTFTKIVIGMGGVLTTCLLAAVSV